MAEAPSHTVRRSYRIPFAYAASHCPRRRTRQRASLLRFMLDRSHVGRFEFNAALRARHSVSVHF